MTITGLRDAIKEQEKNLGDQVHLQQKVHPEGTGRPQAADRLMSRKEIAWRRLGQFNENVVALVETTNLEVSSTSGQGH